MALPAPLDVAAAAKYLGAGAPDTDFLEQLREEVVGLAPLLIGRNLTPPGTGDPDTDETITTGDWMRWVRVPDARAITTVVADDSELEAGVDYDPIVHAAGGTIVHLVLRRRPARTVVITGKFGITPLPPELAGAFYAHAARNYREKDAGYADLVETADGGAQHYFRQLPPRVRMVYQQFRVSSDTQGLA